MMRNTVRLSILALVGSAGLVGAAHAAAPTITGSLSFKSPMGTNHFNPAKLGPTFGVPAGYGNSSSNVNVPITSGIEFGYDDLANTDTADFTDNTLTITDVVKGDAFTFYMTFVSSQARFFDQFSILNVSNFTGFSSTSDNGTKLSVYSAGAPGSGVHQITFGFLGTAAPEPATWAMMIMGFGFVGAAMRLGAKRERQTVAAA